MTRIVVLVDEATEPSLSEAEASRRRADLVAMANSGGPSSRGSAAGANIAYAIRKRLKSDDAAAVMNTLKLLDELMRSCAYFYRYVSDDKMFRRLWRFVVPDYKNGVRSMIPFTRRGSTAADLRATAGRPDIAVKVLILIRAWAEELSVMYNGKYDPSAGFLIERYNSKRARIKFPDVPKTELPWVCPVGPNANQHAANVYSVVGGASSSRGGRAGAAEKQSLPESLSLGEVENTVNLFENIIDNANHVSELKTDVTKELGNRCRLIYQNIDRLSMSMDKEEELARAVKVSEQLRRTISAYDESIRSGEIAKLVPIVSGVSRTLDSDDDTYDNSRQGSSSAGYRSQRSEDGFVAKLDRGKSSRVPPDLPRASRSKRSTHRTTMDRSHSHDSHLNSLAATRLDDFLDGAVNAREKREEAQRQFHREYVMSKRGDDQQSGRRERSASSSPPPPQPPTRAATHERKRERSRRREEEGGKDEEQVVAKRSDSKRKSSKRELKKMNTMYVASSSVNKGAKKKSGKKLERSMSALASPLVDISAPDAESMGTESSSEAAVKKDDIFALLGERYGTEKSSESSHERITGEGEAQLSARLQNVHVSAPQQLQQQQQQHQQQHAMYQSSLPNMPYGSVLMMPQAAVPNPMAMYGSVNPMLSANPYSAYNTINPAMYYNSVNPLATAYASQNPALAVAPQPFGNPFLQQQPQQQMQQPQMPQMQQQQQPPPGMQQTMPHVQQSAGMGAQSNASSLPPASMHQQMQVQRQPPPPPAPATYTTVSNAPAPPPPHAPPPPAQYTTVSNAPAPPPPTAPLPMMAFQNQAPPPSAAAFQATMANAAAMYNAAAAAYHSVSGAQPPLLVVQSQPVVPPHQQQQQEFRPQDST